MTTRSIGNNDEEYNVTPVLIHPEGEAKRLVTHFTPTYRARGTEEPYQPIVHESFPIFSLDEKATIASEEEDLPVKSAMILKGKGLFTEKFVGETAKYVRDYLESRANSREMQIGLDKQWEELDADTAKEACESEDIGQSGIPEARPTTESISRDVYVRKTELQEKMRLSFRANAGLECVAQHFPTAIENNWNSIKSREVESENQLIENMLSRATAGVAADLAIKEEWGRYLKLRTESTRAQAYLDLNKLEEVMINFSSVLGQEEKGKVIDRLARLESSISSIATDYVRRRDEFHHKVHSRYGLDLEIPDSGSKWNALWSQHQEKLVGKTKVRYEFGSSDSNVTRPVGRIAAEYILGDEGEQQWHPIAHPDVPSFSELTKQDCDTHKPPGKRFNARNFLSKGESEGRPTHDFLEEMSRKALSLDTAMTQISEARNALKEDEQGLAELKRVEAACREIKNTIPEAITSNMQALYDREVSQWNKSFRDSEMIAQRVIPNQGELIRRWMDRMQTSLRHHDCLERARLTSLTAHLREDAEESSAALDVQHKLEEDHNKLNWGNQRFLTDFDETFVSETRIPINGEEWQRLCTRFPAASGGAKTVFDVNQPSDYSSYTRRNTASGPQGFCKIPHKYLVLWGKT
ncbi:uncharacterized protein L199_001486 [Kwoniella botswanensis]|uniref:uncharacterized protein n=1 Tax=Kwoniella botswanensis TaxID=1268659 RepID=UPI00315C544C